MGDFGFSTACGRGNTLATPCGSPPYAAPELFGQKAYVGQSADVWALGVLLYFMVSGALPFAGTNLHTLRSSILLGGFAVPAHVPRPCQRLLTDILRRVPADRPTVEQIMACDWLRGVEYPRAFPPPGLTPGHLADASRVLSADETDAKAALAALGVTELHLLRDRSPELRGAITGTYRVLHHRIQKRRSAEALGYHGVGSHVSLGGLGQERVDAGGGGGRRLTVVCVIM